MRFTPSWGCLLAVRLPSVCARGSGLDEVRKEVGSPGSAAARWLVENFPVSGVSGTVGGSTCRSPEEWVSGIRGVDQSQTPVEERGFLCSFISERGPRMGIQPSVLPSFADSSPKGGGVVL